MIMLVFRDEQWQHVIGQNGSYSSIGNISLLLQIVPIWHSSPLHVFLLVWGGKSMQRMSCNVPTWQKTYEKDWG